MAEAGIRDFLMKHAEKSTRSFHMPGHKGAGIYRECGYGEFLERMMDGDITEIRGADNLFKAEGIIEETAQKYARLYQVKRSYLLVNGSSGGIIAGILASVNPGKKLIMARNCHKSVFNAVILGDIEPVYAYPARIEEYHISGEVEEAEIKRLLEENPDAQAVVLPSPNYYGICSDIEAIARTVHRFGKTLIVDQAHGAHLKFMEDMPPSAEEAGADIVINSTHKTLASFTQSAILNFNSDRISREALEEKLQIMESSSPSYILMASLDINADILREHGKRLFSRWQENLQFFYENVRKIDGLRVMEGKGLLDRTKINLDMSLLGIDGLELENRLMEKGIFCELTSGNLLMCMTGIGNTRDDMEALLRGLEEIAEACGGKRRQVDFKKTDDGKNNFSGADREKVKKALKYKDIWNKRRPVCGFKGSKELLKIDFCRGRVCASSVIPYPPGIPLICPGEIIGQDDVEYIKYLLETKQKVIGINHRGQISVVSGK